MRLFQFLATVGMIATLGTAQTIRVGTFHKQSIVVAYYRSALWSDALKQRMTELTAAKKSGDAVKVKDLEKWGSSSQNIAHRQLAGEAPITSVLDALKPAFSEVAQKAGVAVIAPELAYSTASVQTVDVTDYLLDWLKADEATRKIVRELRSRQP